MNKTGRVRIPAFMEYGFDDLKRVVIENGRCSRCGTCAAFCDKIEIADEPKFRFEYDTVCGLCYTICPRTFIMDDVERRIFQRARTEREDAIGIFRKCYAVRRSDSLNHLGQDGGAVTALLAYAIDKRIIDCAVVTSAGKAWRASAHVARDYDALRASAGTKYTIFPSVLGVRDAIEAGCSSIGFVGLPCQIQGLRMIQMAEPYDVHQEKLKMLIGLFCMENFNEEMLDFIDKHVFPIENVRKFDIKGGEMIIYDERDKHSVPLSEIERFVGEGCLVCMDFASELADISVGSIGSPDGFSTVIVRTEAGEELVEGAIRDGYVVAEAIGEDGLNEVAKIARLKKRRGGRE